MKDHDIFVTSDWHLGHDTLVDHGHRPADFTQKVIDNHIMAGMRAGDVLLNLGDAHMDSTGELAVKQFLTWARDRGIKSVLVRGNHDSTRFERSMRMGWDWVCDSTALRYHNKNFLFTHVPVETDFVEDYNVHGHLHGVDGHRGRLIRDGKHILISMEMLNYHPIPLDTLIRLGSTPVRALGKFVAENADSREEQLTNTEIPREGVDGGILEEQRHEGHVREEIGRGLEKVPHQED